MGHQEEPLFLQDETYGGMGAIYEEMDPPIGHANDNHSGSLSCP